MATTYTYEISTQFLPGEGNGTVNINNLLTEIQTSAITTALDYINRNGDILDIIFKSQLSSADRIILDGQSDPNPAVHASAPAGGLISQNNQTPNNSNNTNNISNVNTYSTANQVAYNFTSGTAVSSSITSITLDSNALPYDYIYNNYIIEIISGTGRNQVRLINDYIGSTKVAYVNPWGIFLDSTSKYVIHKNSGQCPPQEISDMYSIRLPTNTASFHNDFYTGTFIKIIAGEGSGQIRLIKNYNGTTRIATLDNKWDVLPDFTSLYAIYGEGGTAQSGHNTSIVLEASHGHSSINDYYNGLYIEIYAGTGMGQVKKITSYTGSILTVTVLPWSIIPDSTSKYIIYGGWCGQFEQTLNNAQTILNTTIDIENGQKIIKNQQYSYYNNGTSAINNYCEHNYIDRTQISTSNVISQYYRTRIIGLGTTITGSIVTLLSNYTVSLKDIKAYNSNNNLNNNIKNNNKNNNTNNNTLINKTNNLSAFGELKTVNLTPVEQLSFIYNIDGTIIQDKNSGTIIGMTTKGTGTVAQVQTICLPDGSQFTSSGVGKYFFIYSGSNAQFYVWFNVTNGSNTNPTPGGTGIQVNINSNDTPSQVALAASSAINANANFDATILLGNIVQITNSAIGAATSIQPGTIPITSSSIVQHDSPNSMLSLTNGAGIGWYSVAKSAKSLKYRSGQGAMGRFTAMFTQGTTGTGQIAGIGNQVSGLFFGYNGADFGILHRSSGQPIIYKLQITTAATSASNVIVTLDGIDYSIPVTNQTGVPYGTASQIAAYNFLTGEWLTEIIGNTIYFISKIIPSGGRNKTYSFNARTTGAVGTMSLVINQTNIINTWIKQTDWNVNKLDGTNNSMILDPTKGNVYEIQFQWLGFGSLKFYVENQDTSNFSCVHEIKYANRNTVPSMIMPNVRLIWSTYTETSAVQNTVKGVSGALMVEGNISDNLGKIFSTSTTTLGISTRVTILTLKNTLIFCNKGNNVEVKPKLLQLTNDAVKSATVRIYLDGTRTSNIFNYQSIDSNSAIIKDTINTSVPTGGNLIASFVVGGSTSLNVEIDKLGIILHSNETLSFTVERNTTTNVDISLAITWYEEQ